MTSKENFIKTVNHQQPERIVVDFGATSVTGIHALIIEKLRMYYDLEKRPVKIIEPYQMLGEVDEELQEIMGVDVIGIFPKDNAFGVPNKDWKTFKTFWGQEVLLPGEFNCTYDEGGNLLIHPEGDSSVPASGKMPVSGYFFDAIERQEPINKSKLNPIDNLEEFGHITEENLTYWKEKVDALSKSNKAVIATFGGMALGDIALVPATNLKHPKGIRSVAEFYISTIMRVDYIKEIFEKQTDIAIENLKKIYDVVGNRVDAVFICGTDFGTQNSTFYAPETLDDLWAPYYRKMNDWIHQNTTWKTFKHSCGAIEPFMSKFIEAGFDIINPVQISAAGMDTKHLKRVYGDKLVFWGGCVDTQGVFAFGTPQQVKEQVQTQCRILAENGGFVFNTVHNIQANVPVENVVAMIDVVKNYNP